MTNHGLEGQDSLTKHIAETMEETVEETVEEAKEAEGAEEVCQQQEMEGTRKEGAMERS